MPSAAPIPRGPSVLLLGSAAALLKAPGCPVCRYAAESGDAYLTWFALEGHGDTHMLGRLCASRGMCARHTRQLLAQPGAATRLTAVYRYVVAAAAENVGAALAPCPACEHEAAAENRVLDTLLEEIAAEERSAYEEHGGLCVPHLRRAVRRNKKRDVRWLIRFMITRLSAPEPGLDLIAGGPDPDAGSRAALRAVLPRQLPAEDARTCRACWAAADAERAQLAVARPPGLGQRGDLAPDCLCAPHLRDAVPGGESSTPEVLAWQAERHAERLARVLDGHPRRLGISPGWLSARARRALADPDCPVCARCPEAVSREIGRLAAMLRAAGGRPQVSLPVCVRHASDLRAADASAGWLAVWALSAYAGQLLTELDDAFRKATWAHRRDVRGPEMSAWRRAAVFLDGSVLGGCPVS